MDATGYFKSRFSSDPRRAVLWKALCRYKFNQIIDPASTVLELGAGYGYFINNVVARRKIAIDVWEDLPNHLNPGVEGHVGNVTDLTILADSSVDFAFASNLFEHLSLGDVATTLRQLRRVLKPNGTLNLLQPNYRYAFKEYFDDYTHVSIFSHISLCDLLESHGFAVFECRPRFLPLTIKSRFPVHPSLIWLYLRSPWKPLGKQMLLRARRV